MINNFPSKKITQRMKQMISDRELFVLFKACLGMIYVWTVILQVFWRFRDQCFLTYRTPDEMLTFTGTRKFKFTTPIQGIYCVFPFRSDVVINKLGSFDMHRMFRHPSRNGSSCLSSEIINFG
jgi:flagellar biosynthesis protein FlhB